MEGTIVVDVDVEVRGGAIVAGGATGDIMGC